MELRLPEGDEMKKQLLSAEADVEAVARSVLGQGGPTRAGHRRFFDLEVENLVGHLRKAELAKYLEQNIEALQANQQITQVGYREFEIHHRSKLGYPFEKKPILKVNLSYQ